MKLNVPVGARQLSSGGDAEALPGAWKRLLSGNWKMLFGFSRRGFDQREGATVLTAGPGFSAAPDA